MRNNNGSDGIFRPFLRWAGGKFYLSKALLQFVPSDVLARKYHEPFLGGGSLFFALRHPNAFLSDLNAHLIGCYTAIRENPAAVSRALRVHARKNSESYYYSVRDLYNRSPDSVARAARFLYLNRTGFNGVFRVNKQGAYNVPYGRKERPLFPTPSELRAIAGALRNAKLSVHGYEQAVDRAKSGDFIYLDPPYPPLNGTSFFTHYTRDRFGKEDQERVAAAARDLDRNGSLVMISNADTEVVRRLYRGFVIRRLTVTRYVSSSSVKHQVGELIITNYEPTGAMRAG